MAHLPNIMKTIAKRFIHNNSNSNPRNQQTQQLDELIVQESEITPTESFFTEDGHDEAQSAEELPTADLKGPTEQHAIPQDSPHVREYFVNLQKRRLKVMYPSFTQEQIGQTADRLWLQLEHRHRQIYARKLNQETQLENIDTEPLKKIAPAINQESQESGPDKSQTNQETDTKNQILAHNQEQIPAIEARQEEQLEADTLSMQETSANQSQARSDDVNHQNDETKASLSMSEPNASRIIATQNFILLPLQQVEKSESNDPQSNPAKIPQNVGNPSGQCPQTTAKELTEQKGGNSNNKLADASNQEKSLSE